MFVLATVDKLYFFNHASVLDINNPTVLNMSNKKKLT